VARTLDEVRPSAAGKDDAGAFQSILFLPPTAEIDAAETPAFFGDLNLDQLFEAVAAGRDEYNLQPLFRTPLRDVDAIAYRHEALRELESEAVRRHITVFGKSMRDVRTHLGLAEKLYYRYEKASWLLHAAAIYCEAVG
jgi:DNA mismatch repair protein MutS